MKKFLLVLFVCITTCEIAISQELNDYKYVQVPESYEFLKDPNQYRLNELTVFLLEKQGFEVFYGEGLPADIDVCQVLQTHLEEDSGLFTTRLVLRLKNCQGVVVFESEEGKSREKDFKVAYHESLRNAFNSLEYTNYTYNGKSIAQSKVKEEKAVEALAEEVSGNEKMTAEKTLPEVVPAAEEEDKLRFRNGTVEYQLVKSESGYHLFKESHKEAFAKLIKSSGGDSYIYSSSNVQGNAYFDASGNLVVEYLDQTSGQLINIHYSKM